MKDSTCHGLAVIIGSTGGIIDGAKYFIEDTESNYKKWKKLQYDFINSFSEFTADNCEDYELPDWHDGIMHLWVYLYNEKFYNASFVQKILNILIKHKECFAAFECYNENGHFIGDVKIYKDKINISPKFANSDFFEKICK